MRELLVKDNAAGLSPLLADYSDIFVVYDCNLEDYVKNSILPNIPEGKLHGTISLCTSEEDKSFQSVVDICRKLYSEGATRESMLLGVGGGITTDMVGFAASIYMRGIRFAFVPTTLLAMVDAATGGKNGVNLDDRKNILGCFTKPDFTYIDSSSLATLPRREFLCGEAEVLKTFIIDDRGRYTRAVELFSKVSSWDQAVQAGLQEELTSLIEEAVSTKQTIVEHDFRDKGERMKLNLGHTFAHAIEALSRHDADGGIAHGEAVAMGMVLAAGLAEEKGLASKGLQALLKADFKACGLKVECPYSMEQMLPVMAMDKKNQSEGIRYILPSRIGEVNIVTL